MDGNIENIIQELIKIEGAADEINQQMAEDQKRLPQMIERRAQELEAEMAAKTRAAVQKIKDMTLKEADERILEITASTQRMFANLEIEYEKNSEKWTQDIFNKIVGR